MSQPAVLVVQTESRSEIVGAIAIFTQPEETLANHQLCQRATILALCRFVHLRKASNIASLIACGGVTETTL
jgi:hypothetical protein